MNMIDYIITFYIFKIFQDIYHKNKIDFIKKMFIQSLNNGLEGPKASIIEPVTEDESELIRKVHNLAISEGCIIFLFFIESSPNASM